MQKKLTITMDEKVCAGLRAKIGRGNIGRFLEELARPYVLPPVHKKTRGGKGKLSPGEEAVRHMTGRGNWPGKTTDEIMQFLRGDD